MNLHGARMDARETVKENPCKLLRAARGIVTNAVKTLPYALAVLHEIKSGYHPPQDDDSSIMRVSCNVNACLVISLIKSARLCIEHARSRSKRATTRVRSYDTRASSVYRRGVPLWSP